MAYRYFTSYSVQTDNGVRFGRGVITSTSKIRTSNDIENLESAIRNAVPAEFALDASDPDSVVLLFFALLEQIPADVDYHPSGRYEPSPELAELPRHFQ